MYTRLSNFDENERIEMIADEDRIVIKKVLIKRQLDMIIGFVEMD